MDFFLRDFEMSPDGKGGEGLGLEGGKKINGMVGQPLNKLIGRGSLGGRQRVGPFPSVGSRSASVAGRQWAQCFTPLTFPNLLGSCLTAASYKIHHIKNCEKDATPMTPTPVPRAIWARLGSDIACPIVIKFSSVTVGKITVSS